MILKSVAELLIASVSWPATSRVAFATKKLKNKKICTQSVILTITDCSSSRLSLLHSFIHYERHRLSALLGEEGG